MSCIEIKIGCRKHSKKEPFKSLTVAVDEFNQSAKEQIDLELAHYSPQNNTFQQALTKACAFEDENGNKHSHQWRIKHSAAGTLKDKLTLLKKEDITSFMSFDDLLNFIDKTLREIPGIGDLAIYDTATRLGSYLELSPDLVYLHAGTLEGAKNLLGGHVSKLGYLKKCDLPEEFNGLSPDQIENLLCIFKDRLKPNLLSRK